MTFLSLAYSAAGSANDPLYSVHSKDVGWSQIDVKITEVERNDRVSLFHVPNYAKRSAMESRFAMCAFSQAALLREFSHWVSAYPAPDPDHVYVGFYREYFDAPEDLFDDSFKPPDGRYLPGAAKFAGMCQFFDPYTGETPDKLLRPAIGETGSD